MEKMPHAQPVTRLRMAPLFQAENGLPTWLALSVHVKSKRERPFVLISLVVEMSRG